MTQDALAIRAASAALFEGFRLALPQLSMTIDHSPPYVELSFAFPPQENLLFEVSGNLQNVDELFLHVGSVFTGSWFPCDDPQTRAAYDAAVRGVITGSYRVTERYRGTRPIGAVLERFNTGRWARVTAYSRVHLPFPWTVNERILRNVEVPAL